MVSIVMVQGCAQIIVCKHSYHGNGAGIFSDYIILSMMQGCGLIIAW